MSQPLELHGFDLPIYELQPGFIVPIFKNTSGEFFLHHFNRKHKVEEAVLVQPSNLFIALSTIRATKFPRLKLLSIPRVSIGDSAHRAFFDGIEICWGARLLLQQQLRTCQTSLHKQLIHSPFALAQALDFIDQGVLAQEIRDAASSTVFSFSNEQTAPSSFGEKTSTSRLVFSNDFQNSMDTIAEGRREFSALVGNAPAAFAVRKQN
jgi:hypothetical protein